MNKEDTLVTTEMVEVALSAFAAGQHPSGTPVEVRMKAALQAAERMIFSATAKKDS